MWSKTTNTKIEMLLWKTRLKEKLEISTALGEKSKRGRGREGMDEWRGLEFKGRKLNVEAIATWTRNPIQGKYPPPWHQHQNLVKEIENFRGKKVQNERKMPKNLLFYNFCAEFVKFGLILTHLKLFFFWRGGEKGKKIFWQMTPPPPPPPWCCHWIL